MRVLLWIAAVVAAVAIGVVAVSTVGAQVRGRGPLGSEVISPGSLEDPPTANPTTAVRADEFTGEWGEFVVNCQGQVATGESAQPSAGWQLGEQDFGPDDDVDVEFVSGDRMVSVEVFCNHGVPTIAEIEEELGSDD